ncbi:Chain A, iron Centre cytochrome c protein [Candidatus Electronema halotolerans]
MKMRAGGTRKNVQHAVLPRQPRGVCKVEECTGRNMEQDGITRRKMLVGTGALAAGAALTHVSGLISPAAASGGQLEKWPWPYKILDPKDTAELAYNEWYRIFCGAAVISSVFGQLRELIGEPYTLFPIDAFVYLEGGQAGWGTICGAAAGANVVANMIIGPRIDGSTIGHQIATDIMQWYSQTQLPVYKPQEPKINAEPVKTMSNSPLCHISVGKWMKAANKPLVSPERKDRCARVTASTAYRLVELLNKWKQGGYESNTDFNCGANYGITGQFNCTDCHGSNVPQAPQAPHNT